ncbi:MAG: sulfatase-like hydrolase/transferase, partial [Isosphaeraceae bacterium]
LLTGRYHWRTRLQQGIVGVWGQPLIAADRLTIASLAKGQGYRTACIGKWHLGREWPISQDEKPFFEGFGPNFKGVTADHVKVWADVFNRPIPGGPTTRGFDYYFGTDVPNWPPYCFIQNDRTIGIPSELLPQSKFVKNQASLPGPALPGWQFEPILPRLAEEASRFIIESAAKGENYLLYLPLTTPHTPLAVNSDWKGKSGLENDAADLIIETDAALGRVLDAVSKTGKAENTLVVFTSDNGFAAYVGAKDLEARGHYPSGPLRGYKMDVYEGGHRVPFMIRWPTVVKPGSVSGQLVHHADLIATLADIFGEKLPENAGEDSFSLLPILRGEDRPVRETAVSTANIGIPGFRQGPWKLILAPDPVGKTDVQLYNLSDDLGEKQNLAESQAERVKAMRIQFEKIITDGRSTPGPKQKNDVRGNRYPREPDAAKKKQATAKSVSLDTPLTDPSTNLSIVGPWNLAELRKATDYRWLSRQGPIHSLLYKGESYQGHETEVYALYASPATLGKAGAGEHFPGVVLIHGGGGTAFAEWV